MNQIGFLRLKRGLERDDTTLLSSKRLLLAAVMMRSLIYDVVVRRLLDQLRPPCHRICKAWEDEQSRCNLCKRSERRGKVNFLQYTLH